MSKKQSVKLPTGWEWSTIGTVTDPFIEQGLPKDGNAFLYVDISSINSKSKKIIEPKTLSLADAPSRAKQQLKAGDVLVSMTRPNLNAVAMVPENMSGAIGSTGFHVLRADWPISAWLYYIVQTTDFVEAMSGLVQGALYPAIRPRDIDGYRIPIAPIAEQQRIVAEIETQFSRLDVGVENLKRVQANLKHYRSATLQAACEGRLVPTEAALAQAEGRDYEPADKLLARILREHRAKWEADQLAKMKEQGKTPKDDKWKKKYKAPAAPNTSKLPELPEGWVWATVEQLAAFDAHSITDGPFGSNLKTEHYTSSGPRVIRLQNIGDGVFNDVHAHISHEHFEKLEKHRVNAGDIVVAVLGEKLPRACIIPPFVGEAIVKADCVRFKPNREVAVTQYLNVALNAEPTRARTSAIVHGVGRPRLTLGELKAIALPLPPLAEQLRIVAEIESRLSVLGDMEKAVDANLKRSVGLRQKILKEAFEGRLVPQIITEESADVLLERIKLEREKREAEKRSARKKGAKKVEKKRSTPGVRRDLIEVLREAQEAITPEQLFKDAGYKADEVEDFYAELKKADRAQAFTQTVLDNGDVYLAARA